MLKIIYSTLTVAGWKYITIQISIILKFKLNVQNYKNVESYVAYRHKIKCLKAK